MTKTYIVKTGVRIKNSYTVEADSLDAAIELVRDDPDAEHSENGIDVEITAAYPEEDERTPQTPKTRKRKGGGRPKGSKNRAKGDPQPPSEPDAAE